jgi:hypothetical protein
MNTRVLKGVRYPDSRQSQVGTIMIPDVGYWPLRWMRRSPQRSSAPAISAPAISAPAHPALYAVQSTYALERRYFL